MTLTGGVWSLDGTEEIKMKETCEISETRPEKMPKTNWVFCGIVPPDDYKTPAYKAYKLGIYLANELLKKGAKKILDKAKAENNAGIVNAPPSKKILESRNEHTNGNGNCVNGNGTAIST